MGTILRRHHPPAQQQAEQVDGIKPREPRLPEAHTVQLAIPRLPAVVVGQHKPRKQKKQAQSNEAGVDHRCQKAKQLWIGEMEEDDIEGRQGA